MSSTVTLHCKPYVRHWLQMHYGSPVQFPRKSNERHIFNTCLDKNFRPSRDYNKELYSESIEVLVSQDVLSTHGHTLSITLQHYINEHFQHQVDLHLFLFVTAQQLQGYSINAAVKMFLLHNGYTDEVLSFDAAEKKYDRFKKKLSEKIFSTSVPAPKNNLPQHA